MLLAALQIGIAEAILVVGVVGVAIREVADLRGWTRSSRLLRRENEDLVRVNEQYALKINENGVTITKQGEMIKVLEGRVEELSKRDQEAVLRVLKEHEANAERRHMERATDDERRHGDFMDGLVVLRGLLERQIAQAGDETGLPTNREG